MSVATSRRAARSGAAARRWALVHASSRQATMSRFSVGSLGSPPARSGSSLLVISSSAVGRTAREDRVDVQVVVVVFEVESVVREGEVAVDVCADAEEHVAERGDPLLLRRPERDAPRHRCTPDVAPPPGLECIEVVAPERGGELVPEPPVAELAGADRVPDVLSRAQIEQRERRVVIAAQPLVVALHVGDEPVDARVPLLRADGPIAGGRCRRGRAESHSQHHGKHRDGPSGLRVDHSYDCATVV